MRFAYHTNSLRNNPLKRKKEMNLPALRLPLREQRTLVEYIGCVLLHSGSPITICEVEKELEPTTDHTLESATWVVPESRYVAQSIPEIGVDRCLIDLWSANPVPTLNSTPSPPVPSGCLDAVRSHPETSSYASARLPRPIQSPGSASSTGVVQLLGFAPTTNSAQLFCGIPDHQLGTSASPRSSKPLTPPQPVSSTPALLSLSSTVVHQPLDSSGLPLTSGSASVSHRFASATDFQVPGSLDPPPLQFLSGFTVVLTPSVVALVSRSSGSTLAVEFALQFELSIAYFYDICVGAL